MSVLREAISHATLGWVKPDLDEILRQAGLVLEQYAEQGYAGGAIETCASLLHRAHGTLRMLELAAPALVAEEMERLAHALRDGKVEQPAEASATLMRGTVLLPDYLERLQGGHRDIPIVLLPLINDLRAARGAAGMGEQVLLESSDEAHSEAELDHARSSLSGRNRALMESVGSAVKEELLQVKEQMDLYLRGAKTDPAQLQPQVETLGNVADTLQLLGMSAARAGVLAQRDALALIATGQQAVSEDRLLDIAGALLHVDAAVEEQALNLGAIGDEDDAERSRNNEMRELVGVLISEALNDLAEARRLFVAFIETSWDHSQLIEVPRLLHDVAGAMRMLELSEPAACLDALRAYIKRELERKHRVPDARQLDQLADALSSLEYYLEAVRDQRPRREDILEIARTSLDALGVWPPPSDADLAEAADFVDLSLVEALPVAQLIDVAPDAVPDSTVAPLPPPQDTTVALATETAPQVDVAPLTAADTAVDGFQLRNDDIDDEIREVFLEEFAEEIDNLARLLPVWRTDPENLEALRPIRRAFHTLKGSGRLVGADTLGELSWSVENALNRVLDGTRPANAAMVDLVAQAQAALPQLHQALQGKGDINTDLGAIQARAAQLASGEEAATATVEVDAYAAQATDEETIPQLETTETIDVQPVVADAVESIEFLQDAEVEVTHLELAPQDDGAASDADALAVNSASLELMAAGAGLSLLDPDENPVDASEDVRASAASSWTTSLANTSLSLEPLEETDVVLAEDVLVTEQSAAEQGDAAQLDAAEFFDIEPTESLSELELAAEPDSDADVLPESSEDALAPGAGAPASVDAVLLEILDAEITAHLATLDEWQSNAVDNGLRVDDRLLRAMHTINGAFAMTEVPEITEVTLPAEGYLKRLMAAGQSAGDIGFSAISDTGIAIRQTLAGLNEQTQWVPAFPELAERLTALRDALPAPQPQVMPVDLIAENAEPLTVEESFETEEAIELVAIDALDDGNYAIDSSIEAFEDVAVAHEVTPASEADMSIEASGPGEALPQQHAPVTFFEVTQTYRLSAEPEAIIGNSDAAVHGAGDALQANVPQDLEGGADPASLIDPGLVDALPGLSLPGGARDTRDALDSRRAMWSGAALEDVGEHEDTAAGDVTRGAVEEADSVEGSATDSVLSEVTDASSEQSQLGVSIASLLAGKDDEASGLSPSLSERDMQVSAEVGLPEPETVPDASNWMGAGLAAAAATTTAIIPAFAEDPDEALDLDASDPELIDVFLEEGVDLLDHSDGLLSELDGSEDDRERVDGLLRDLHTIKGGARMAGLFPVGDLSHAIESVLESANEQGGLRRGDRQLLQRGFDRLHAMLTRVSARRAIGVPQALIYELEARAHGQQLSVTEADAYIEEASALAPEFKMDAELESSAVNPEMPVFDSSSFVEVDPAIEAESIVDTEPVVEDDAFLEANPAVEVEVEAALQAEAIVENESIDQTEPVAEAAPTIDADWFADAESLVATEPVVVAEFAAQTAAEAEPAAVVAPIHAPKVLKELSEPIELEFSGDDEDPAQPLAQDQVRVRADLLDRLVNNAGEVAIYRAHLEQQLGSFRNAMAEMEQTNARMRDQLRRLDIETEAQIVARYQREQDQGDSSFDPLELDRFSNLQQLSRALGESAADLTSLQGVLDDLARQYDGLLHQQSRVSAELQDGLMRTRMLPFDTIATRLRRVVRQAADDSAKQVNFVMVGAHGELDRNVLQRMIAPLEHMLRNAVAHGLETSWARANTDKSTQGNITLSLAREGSELVLQVADDGMGLNHEVILARAIERGLLSVDANASAQEIESMIFEPGFSTAESVSHLAGRGVGMDVVRNEVRQLGGTIDIASERGAGTTFTLRLPQTLAVTRAVLVQAGDASFAVPVAALQGVGHIDRARLVSPDGSNYRYGGEDYPLYDLSRLVGQAPSKVDASTSDSMPLLLISVGSLRAAIAVDNWLGSREMVVKPVGPQIASVPGIHGATVLSDGRIALILDLAPLVRRQVNQPQLTQSVAPEEPRQAPLVMVVDDSLTMRKVTGRVLERHNFEVVVARDGVEALEKLAERVPDLLLLDIEMPRMDGYELATRMKADEHLRNVPIVMITSRTGDKHRQRAFDIGVERYMGKPYQEQDLMRNVFDMLGLSRARD